MSQTPSTAADDQAAATSNPIALVVRRGRKRVHSLQGTLARLGSNIWPYVSSAF